MSPSAKRKRNEYKKRWRQRIIEKKVREQGGKCYYCKCQLITLTFDNRAADATIEHLKPKYEKGDNRQSNIVAACNKCNNDKGNMNYEEYSLIRLLRGLYWQSRLRDIAKDFIYN